MPEYTNNTWSHWIIKQIRDGRTWEEIENLCVPAAQAESVFARLREEKGLLPKSLRFSEWRAYVEQQKRVSRADTLIAIFDQNSENRAHLKEWLLHYSMPRSAELERIWFTEDALNKVARYAMGFHIAFISLDDPGGAAIGQRLYECNPDCIIGYYSDRPRELGPLLHSRPYEFFRWSEGEAGFSDRLDDMLSRVVNSRNVFCYETKKMLYCYPVGNILYFQSDLKQVHIKTVVGNDADLYAKLIELEAALDRQGLLDHFIRLHKRYIVNRRLIHRVCKGNHTAELATGEQVPVSEAYYKTVIRALGR